MSAHSSLAFKAALSIYQHHCRGRQIPLILDSGCGTALSTERIAAEFDRAFVIGIDKSVDRLSRAFNHPRTDNWPANALVVRGDLAQIWRLLRRADLSVDRHYLLYPNPWPKTSQQKRRWYAHPAFADLIAITNELVMRTDSHTYANEFRDALAFHGFSARVDAMQPASPLTRFEEKYQARGHPLLELRCFLGDSAD